MLDGYAMELIQLDGRLMDKATIHRDERTDLILEDPAQGVYILAIRDPKQKLWYSEKVYLTN